jgi:hypothetical protein
LCCRAAGEVGFLRQTGVGRPKERSVDTMLFDVGVPASTIAKLLGKTERAVNMRVAADREKKPGRKARPTKKKAA